MHFDCFDFEISLRQRLVKHEQIFFHTLSMFPQHGPALRVLPDKWPTLNTNIDPQHTCAPSFMCDLIVASPQHLQANKPLLNNSDLHSIVTHPLHTTEKTVPEDQELKHKSISPEVIFQIRTIITPSLESCRKLKHKTLITACCPSQLLLVQDDLWVLTHTVKQRSKLYRQECAEAHLCQIKRCTFTIVSRDGT